MELKNEIEQANDLLTKLTYAEIPAIDIVRFFSYILLCNIDPSKYDDSTVDRMLDQVAKETKMLGSMIREGELSIERESIIANNPKP